MMSKRGTCDYCSCGPRVLKGSPFLSDSGAKMCSACWKDVKSEYWDSSMEFIPTFKNGPRRSALKGYA